MQGGSALSAGGQGQPGGVVHLVAHGDVIDSIRCRRRPRAPSVPPAPATPTPSTRPRWPPTSTRRATAVIAGDVTTGGGDATRTIVGERRSFRDRHAARRRSGRGAGRGSISRRRGTLYVAGTVDASGAPGGQAGGAIHLSANQIVITGKLLSSGGDGDEAGGAAGAITIA